MDSDEGRIDRSDLLALERAHERLSRFVREHPLAPARAMAIARFIHALQADPQWRDHYLPDLLEPFLAALSRLRRSVADPEHVEAIRNALQDLARAGLIAPDEAERCASGLTPETAAGGPDPGAGISRVRVLFAQTLPAMPHETVGSAIGLAATLTAVPRGGRVRAGHFHWHNDEARRGVGSLRALEDVSADALTAAVESVSTLAPAARRSGRRLAFDLSLPEKQIPIAGDSIGLALAVVFAGALIGMARRGGGLRPRADLAWTGCVRPSGRIVPVDSATLPAKLRAAHFAGCRAIVVPAEMGDEVEAEVERQGLGLRVIGVAHLAEALGDPELFEPLRLPPGEVEACTREKARRAISIAALVALGALVAWHVPPRATRFEVIASRHEVKVAYRGLLPPYVVNAGGPIAFARMVDRLDGDPHPGRRLVIATRFDMESGHAGDLQVYDLALRRRIWSYRFTASGLPYEPQNVYGDGLYSAKAGDAGDLDGDGRDEIALSVCYGVYAASFIWLFDGMRPPSGAVYHEGHLEDLTIADVDGDGAREVAVGGIHQPSRGISVLVLRAADFHPFGATGETPWRREAQPCLTHLVLPMAAALVPVEGRQNLGRGGAVSLGFLAHPEGGLTMIYDVNATNELWQGAAVTDYILSFRAPCRDVVLKVNDVMRQRGALWLREGRAPIDFGSDAFAGEWKAQIWCGDRVLADWPPGPIAAR